MNPLHLLFCALLACLTLSSCASVRVYGDKSVTDTTLQGADEYCKTVWSFFGVTRTFNNINHCDSGLNAEVIFKANPIFSLVNVVTLGIANPERICIKCQTPN